MNVTQIRYFLALCKEGNFTRAARQCGVAQPSLTNAIRALERTLGVVLFVRKPRVRLSPFGRLLQPHLELIMRQLELTHDLAAYCAQNVAPPSGKNRKSTARFTMAQDNIRLRRAS